MATFLFLTGFDFLFFFIHQAQQVQEQPGTACGDDDAINHAIAKKAKFTGQPTTDQSANDAYDQIAQQAKAATFPELTGQPAGDCTYD